jgi:hypothetical protein
MSKFAGHGALVDASAGVPAASSGKFAHKPSDVNCAEYSGIRAQIGPKWPSSPCFREKDSCASLKCNGPNASGPTDPASGCADIRTRIRLQRAGWGK